MRRPCNCGGPRVQVSPVADFCGFLQTTTSVVLTDTGVRVALSPGVFDDLSTLMTKNRCATSRQTTGLKLASMILDLHAEVRQKGRMQMLRPHIGVSMSMMSAWNALKAILA